MHARFVLICIAVTSAACPTLLGQAAETPAASTPATSSQAAPQEYQGPSILSRDPTLIGERSGQLIDFRLYASVTGVYDSGLTPVSVNSTGSLVSPAGDAGVELGFGAVGSKTWKRASLSLEYRGTYRHYANNAYYDGTDQFLNMRYGRILARHLTFDFKETAGTTNLANGAFTFLPLTNTDLVAVPANELFDNRTYFSQSRVSLIYQKTARLSFSIGGDGYIVHRQSFALAGLLGYGLHGDMAYRITRRQTLDLSYNFTHYEETRVFGYAGIHTVSAGYSLGLGRAYDFGLTAGGSYLSYRGLEQVSVDPAVAAIIGQQSVIHNFQSYTVVPYGQIRMTRHFKSYSVNADASTGVSPGNGVYLTSKQTTAGGGFNYLSPKKWTLGARFSYSRLASVGQQIGTYQGYQGGLGMTYRINSTVHAELRYDYRHYTTQNEIFLKDSQRISLGFAFSSGDKPLPIW